MYTTIRWCLGIFASAQRKIRSGHSSSLFKGEPVQVDVVFWCGEQIDQLSHLRLERGLQMGQLGSERRKHLSPAHLEEELDNVNVVRFFPKVRLEQLVDSCLEHESVVDGNVADSGLRQCQLCNPRTLSFIRTYRFVPARLATSGDAGVHHVVRDEKVRLELGAGVQQCPKVTNPSGAQHRGETGRHRRTEGSGPPSHETRDIRTDLQDTTSYGPLTSSTPQPSTAALKYSSSVRKDPLRISTVSTTLSPLLSFPPGVL